MSSLTPSDILFIVFNFLKVKQLHFSHIPIPTDIITLSLNKSVR